MGQSQSDIRPQEEEYNDHARDDNMKNNANTLYSSMDALIVGGNDSFTTVLQSLCIPIFFQI